METLADLIRRTATAPGPGVEHAVFDTTDPEVIAGRIEAFVAARLGAVHHAHFYTPGVGVVSGLALTDGSDVVVKVHRWNVTTERLSAVQRLQRHLVAAGLPSPRPLVAPEPFGGGIATVEEMIVGQSVDARDAPARTTIARTLHRFISAAGDFGEVPALGQPLLLRTVDAPLWPEPHDVRFDFPATTSGAEWIDDLAMSARRRLQDAGHRVAGHFDWRVENLGFSAGAVVAIYDWDSVGAAPEPAIVGNTAGQFTADWTTDDPDPLPSLAEMEAFIDAYCRARGRPFTPRECDVLDAANLALCTYGARCQHSNLMLHPELGGSYDSQWIRLLRQRGERWFTG